MKTADPELMRAINRFHVLDVVRRYGPISRVEIVQRTELAPATISAITGGLIEENLILARAVERGEADPAKLTRRVRSVAVDLYRHDLLMTAAPLSDEAIVEIVDEVFLPLVRPDAG